MGKDEQPETAAVILLPGEGERVARGADAIEFKLDSSDTRGRFSLMIRTVAGNFQSPSLPHANTREDWALVVLEGDLGFWFEAEHDSYATEVVVPAGSVVYVPRGTYFRWWNPHPISARCLVLYSPAGFEDFFREVFALGDPETSLLTDEDETSNAILAAGDRYGIVRRKGGGNA